MVVHYGNSLCGWQNCPLFKSRYHIQDNPTDPTATNRLQKCSQGKTVHALLLLVDTNNPHTLCRGKRGSSGMVDAPPANFRSDEGGRSRQGRLYWCGGPSQVEESRTDAAAIASEPSRMHTRTAKWTNSQNYRILAWRSPPMAIADVHHTCHIGQVKCTRINIIQHLRVPSSHARSEAENA